ncbi:hypothetical protein BN903_332 [Halorubrum sp. AJ67]|nr:hypothetical protein BN903_332 [Halorubrum sp. AJ67]
MEIDSPISLNNIAFWTGRSVSTVYSGFQSCLWKTLSEVRSSTKRPGSRTRWSTKSSTSWTDSPTRRSRSSRKRSASNARGADHP